MTLFHQTYHIKTENPNHLKAIKKYNKNCWIRQIHGVVIKNYIPCKDLDNIMGDKKEIVIQCISEDSLSLQGIWPSLPVTQVNLPQEYQSNFEKISSYIRTIVNQYSGPNITSQHFSPPKLGPVEIDPDLLMHAINNKYLISGAIKLETEKKIIFEVDEQQFILDYTSNVLKIYHKTSLNFDVDDGFSDSLDDGALCTALNAQYFKPFKESNYTQELISETNSGFQSHPDRMYLIKQLASQLSNLEQKIIQMQEKVKTQPNYGNALEASNILLNTLKTEREAFMKKPDLTVFKNACLSAIDTARPILSVHRDIFSPRFFDTLISIVLGICTLGVSVGITYTCTGRLGLGLFNLKTQSERALDSMVHNLTERPEQKNINDYLHT